MSISKKLNDFKDLFNGKYNLVDLDLKAINKKVKKILDN